MIFEVAPTPPICRLSALAQLDCSAINALRKACDETHVVGAGRSLRAAAQGECMLVVEGWAARAQHVGQGKRQFTQLFLPGDVIYPIDADACSIVGLTKVQLATAPPARESASLERAYERDGHLQTSYLLAHSVRLGALLATEALLDLIAELYERSLIAGLVKVDALHLPLTQEQLGDLLGLTAVHVNRSIRCLRETGRIIWEGRQINIPEAGSIDLYARRNILSLSSQSVFPRRQRYEASLTQS